MERQVVRLVHDSARQVAKHYVEQAPDSWVMHLLPAEKTRAQENHYHGLIRHISHFDTYGGKRRDPGTWKRLLVDDFVNDKEYMDEPPKGHGILIPSIDGERLVQLGFQTHEFSVPEAAQFVTYLLAHVSQRGLPAWRKRR